MITQFIALAVGVVIGFVVHKAWQTLLLRDAADMAAIDAAAAAYVAAVMDDDFGDDDDNDDDGGVAMPATETEEGIDQ